MRNPRAGPPPLLRELDLFSIGQVNALPPPQRQQIYRHLVPLIVVLRFDIDPDTLADCAGRSLFQLRTGASSVELALRRAWEAEDPLLYLELADTPNNQIAVILFVINNPCSKRFDIDRLPDGTPTHFGTQARHIQEEIRAMKAGLAPGQVRQGLGLTRELIPILERFVAGLHHDAFYVQPLAYHNAIVFERLGFAYALGLGGMEWIHKEFGPHGLLYQRLDGSNPFRQPGAEKTVRGRSWAIHDGIMGMPYDQVKMYKRVGIHAGVVTFPDAAW